MRRGLAYLTPLSLKRLAESRLSLALSSQAIRLVISEQRRLPTRDKVIHLYTIRLLRSATDTSDADEHIVCASISEPPHHATRPRTPAFFLLKAKRQGEKLLPVTDRSRGVELASRWVRLCRSPLSRRYAVLYPSCDISVVILQALPAHCKHLMAHLGSVPCGDTTAVCQLSSHLGSLLFANSVPIWLSQTTCVRLFAFTLADISYLADLGKWWR